jgi:hypothetical protein
MIEGLLNDDINRGVYIFLTDSDVVQGETAGIARAGVCKRILVILVDGEVAACLSQPLTAEKYLRHHANVYYYESSKIPPSMKHAITRWFERELVGRMNRVHKDPFPMASKKVQ